MSIVCTYFIRRKSWLEKQVKVFAEFMRFEDSFQSAKKCEPCRHRVAERLGNLNDMTCWFIPSSLFRCRSFFNCLCGLFEKISFSAFSQASTLKRLWSHYATEIKEKERKRDRERIDASIVSLAELNNEQKNHKQRFIKHRNL